MGDTLAVNQPPYICQEETFKKKKKQSIYTCADAVELQVHLTDLRTMQWGGFSSAPSFFLSFITHLCPGWIPGEPLCAVSRLALCTFTRDLWILRITRSVALGFENFTLCSGKGRRDPTGGWRDIQECS